MTRDVFLAQLDTAAVAHASIPQSAGLYPDGPLIRFVVRPPGWLPSAAPGVLDPLGLVWFARTGDWRNILAWLEVATALGLDPETAMLITSAADQPLDRLGKEGRIWRAGMLDVVDRLVVRG